MKKNVLFLFLILTLSACINQPKAPTDSTLPVLDLTKDYPKMEIDIHDIADVEYVALETTDESLLGYDLLYAISDKYIVSLGTVVDPVIHIFDRKGKYLSKIDRYGKGPEEYVNIYNTSIDFDNEECYVYDWNRQQIQVYTFTGQWVRTIKTKEEFIYRHMFNYNQQYLIAHNNLHDYNNVKNFPDDKRPYHLIDKKTGKHTSLDLVIENKVSRTLRKGHGDFESIHIIRTILANDKDMLIADFGLDTLYQYKENKLVPIAVQYPPVHSDDEPLIIAPEIYTDSYLFFKPVRMRYVPDDVLKPYWDAPYLMWNRKTNAIMEVTKWKDVNYPNERNGRFRMIDQCNLPNNIHFRYDAEKLCEKYEAGILKGELKEVASKLKFDDNPVIVICKLK